MTPPKPNSAGKGSTPRNLGAKFRKNYDQIKWRKPRRKKTMNETHKHLNNERAIPGFIALRAKLSVSGTQVTGDLLELGKPIKLTLLAVPVSWRSEEEGGGMRKVDYEMKLVEILKPESIS